MHEMSKDCGKQDISNNIHQIFRYTFSLKMYSQKTSRLHSSIEALNTLSPSRIDNQLLPAITRPLLSPFLPYQEIISIISNTVLKSYRLHFIGYKISK